MSVTTGTPDARKLRNSPLDVDFEIDEPEILSSELVPLRLEVCPVHSDPQVVSVTPSAPDARKFGDVVLAVNLEIGEAKILCTQLFPLRLEAGPVDTHPQLVRVTARTPDAREPSQSSYCRNLEIDETQIVLTDLRPFRFETGPARARPQKMRICSSTPNAGITTSCAHSVLLLFELGWGATTPCIQRRTGRKCTATVVDEARRLIESGRGPTVASWLCGLSSNRRAGSSTVLQHR